MTAPATFQKEERVVSQKLIDELFSNRVKRQIREAYRRHKSLIVNQVPPSQMLVIAFVWLSDQLQPSTIVDSRVKNLLERIAHKQ